MAMTFREKKEGVMQFDENMGTQLSSKGPYFIAVCDETMNVTQVPIHGMMGEHMTLLQPKQANVYEHGEDDRNLKLFERTPGVHVVRKNISFRDLPTDAEICHMRDELYAELYPVAKKKKAVESPGPMAKIRQTVADIIAPPPPPPVEPLRLEPMQGPEESLPSESKPKKPRKQQPKKKKK